MHASEHFTNVRRRIETYLAENLPGVPGAPRLVLRNQPREPSATRWIRVSTEEGRRRRSGWRSEGVSLNLCSGTVLIELHWPQPEDGEDADEVDAALEQLRHLFDQVRLQARDYTADAENPTDLEGFCLAFDESPFPLVLPNEGPVLRRQLQAPFTWTAHHPIASTLL